MSITTIFKKRSRVVSTLLISLMLLSVSAVQALPKAFEANYSVSKGSMHLGNLKVSLKYSANRYQYLKSTKSTGLAAMLTGIKVTEKTDGQVSGQRIIPQNYLYNQSRRGKSRIDKIHFNGKQAVGSYKKKKYNLPVQANTQDRASLELTLAHDIQQNKQNLHYNVIERGKIKQYNFQKLGFEKITTPAGTFNALKVKVVRNKKKRETIFWMAKEINYMPVKIRHQEKGDVITTIIKNYKAI